MNTFEEVMEIKAEIAKIDSQIRHIEEHAKTNFQLLMGLNDLEAIREYYVRELDSKMGIK